MDNKYKYFIVIFLMVSSFAAFGGISGNGFINLDDDEYITGNNYIKSDINPESIKWAFTAVVCSNWHPLTLLSHIWTGVFSEQTLPAITLISLLLHIGAVLFLFSLFKQDNKESMAFGFCRGFFRPPSPAGGIRGLGSRAQRRFKYVFRISKYLHLCPLFRKL